MKKCVIKDLKVVLKRLPICETEKKSYTQLEDGENVTKQLQKSGNKKASLKPRTKSQKNTEILAESSQNELYINLVNLDTQSLQKTCVPKKVEVERITENKVALENNSSTHITCMGCQKYNRYVHTDINKENKVGRTISNKSARLIIPLNECLKGTQLNSLQIRLDRNFNNNAEVPKSVSTKSKEMSTENSGSKTNKSPNEFEREGESKKLLRQRVKQNYAETTINVSEVKQSTDIPKQLPKNKIPVYKQIIEEKKPAKSEDLYDFNEPDLEKTDKRRKQKKYNVNSSKKFNRTMYEILQKIEAKEAKLKNNIKKKGSRKKVEEKSEQKSYGVVIEVVMNNIMEKVNSRKQSGEGTKNTSLNVRSPKMISVGDKEVNISLIQSGTDVNIPKNYSQLKSDVAKTQEKFQKTINATLCDLDKIRSQEISDNIFSSTKMNNDDSDSLDNFYGFHTDKEDEGSAKMMHFIEDFSRRSGIVSKTKNIEISDDIFSDTETSNKNERLNEDSASEDEFHGFCKGKEDKGSEKMMLVIEDFSRQSGIVSKTKNKEISDDIFSDTETSNEDERLNEDSASEDEFYGLCTENASTPLKPKPRINVLGNVLINSEEKESPEVPEAPEDRESPDLFFNLESDANNTLGLKVKYMPWRFNKQFKRNPHYIVLKNSALPCLKQDMVLEYNELKKIIGKSPQAETPKKTPSNDSFESDNQENIHPRSSLFDYESFSPEKNENNERNVLGKKTKRNILMPTIDNYFNIQQKTVDNENLAHRVIRNYSESNRRKKLDLIEKRAKKDNKDVRQNSDEEAEKVQEEAVDSHDDSSDIRLFEDLESEEKAFSLNVPSRIYEKKRRRKRVKSVDSENGAANPKKNAKNCMTKEEEAELEKWAATFNSACDEIDKYELEIE